ncbi:MAG: hypothetical protein AABX01_04000 [Candidatus Micrarchaeota archaeon]
MKITSALIGILILIIASPYALADSPSITLTGTPANSNSATISFNVAPESDGRVYYWISEDLVQNNFTAELLPVHNIYIGGLVPSTTYNFNITSCNQGNCTTFGPGTFQTIAAAPSYPAPQINDASIATSSITNLSSQIAWTTDINSDSKVFFGATTSYGLEQGVNDNLTTHSVGLNGLQPGSTYHFAVQSCNAGNCTNSSDKTFTTAANPTPSATITPTPTQTGGNPTPPSTCVDSDDGKDYYEKGYIISGNEGGDDVCESSAVLKEYLCNDERTIGGTIRYSCPYGCSDGKCQIQVEEKANPAAANASPIALLEMEKKVGFTTTIKAKYVGGSTLITFIQAVSKRISGEIHVVFPFEMKDYSGGKITILPKPLLVKNDGTGKIEAIWDEDLLPGDFQVQLTVPGRVEEAVLETFSAASFLGTELPDGAGGDAEKAALKAANDALGNGTNQSLNELTGLAPVGNSSGDGYGGWFTPLIQLLLLVLGIGAVHYFEGDMHLGAEQTSNILEELDNGPKGKMGK